MSKLAIFLFDYSGVMAAPWHKAGYTVLCVDLLHPEGIGMRDSGFYTLRADLTHRVFYAVWGTARLAEFRRRRKARHRLL